MNKNFLILICSLGLTSCGKEGSWKTANYYFDKGIYAKAIERYEAYLNQAQDLKEQARAHLALARSYSKLSNESRSREHYELAARLDPMGPAAQAAHRELLEILDYFPLKPRTRWEEVDTQTKGMNMYTTNEVEAHPGTTLIRRKIFAGKNSQRLVKEVILFYHKAPGVVWERSGDASDPRPTLLLRYPYTAGSTWNTWREGRKIRRTITKTHLNVEVVAGRFTNCIEIAEAFDQLSTTARIYDTYCPGIGRVSTATGDEKTASVYSELANIDR